MATGVSSKLNFETWPTPRRDQTWVPIPHPIDTPTPGRTRNHRVTLPGSQVWGHKAPKNAVSALGDCCIAEKDFFTIVSTTFFTARFSSRPLFGGPPPTAAELRTAPKLHRAQATCLRYCTAAVRAADSVNRDSPAATSRTHWTHVLNCAETKTASLRKRCRQLLANPPTPLSSLAIC